MTEAAAMGDANAGNTTPAPPTRTLFHHAMRAGAIYSVGMLIAAFIVGLVVRIEFWSSMWEYKFRLMFLIGIFLSVFAQTAVASFINKSGLLKDCGISWLDDVINLSNLFLAVAAIVAIVRIEDYDTHTIATLVYLGIVVLLDIIFGLWAGSRLEEEKKRKLRHICGSIFWRIDFVSFAGVALLAWLAAALSGQSAVRRLVDRIVLPPTASSSDLEKLRDVVNHMPDVFLSGAVGFHFIMTLALIIGLMKEWDRMSVGIGGKK